jgi:hypothetical protein
MQFNTTRSFPFYGWIKMLENFLVKSQSSSKFHTWCFRRGNGSRIKGELQDKVVLGLSGGVDSTVAAVLHQSNWKNYTAFL